MRKVSRQRQRRKPRRRVWQLQEAKAKFSKVVDEAIHDGYQVITRNGRPVVVVVSQKEFEQYQKPEDTLIDFFNRAPYPNAEIDLKRDKDVGRDIDL